jgi:hypothetical protein
MKIDFDKNRDTPGNFAFIVRDIKKKNSNETKNKYDF